MATAARADRCKYSKEGPSMQMLEEVTGFHCRSVMELSLLLGISQTLERSFELAEIVRPTLRRMQDLVGMERGTIALLNRDTRELLLAEAVGLPRGCSPSAYLKVIEPHLQRTVEKEGPVVVPELRNWMVKNEQAWALADTLQVLPGIGLLCVPLKFENEVTGTISIERVYDPEVGWEPDLRLLTMIGAIIGQAARIRQDTAEQIAALREENARLQEAMGEDFGCSNLIGNSSQMKGVYYDITQVAESNTTVFIRGETGTGKELVAKAIHEKSPRADQPFVKFNCAALPDSIIESELFGHEKGAFTGAHAMRKGRFEMAHRGTIFLDEIGDISPTTQIKLLRVLQEHEFERVGSGETIRVDVRVIAATRRNLEEMMLNGEFREDLFYRLNVFPIYVPPLRERKCDLLLLADHFIEKYARNSGSRPPRISSAAIELLMSYHWPGNVRELENCIQRSVLLAKGQSIKAHHLPPTLQTKTAEERRDTATLNDAIQALEREMIVDSLKESRSNMAKAARRLGLTERQMGLRVKKYGINLEAFK